MIELSIIIPHPPDSVVAEYCKEKIKENTVLSYELICEDPEVEGKIVCRKTGGVVGPGGGADTNSVYDAYNNGVKNALGDLIVFSSDDIIFLPGWDLAFQKCAKSKRLLTCELVEPGTRRNVDHAYIHKNFGDKPSNFQYRNFLNWTIDEQSKTKSDFVFGRGGYVPCAMLKESFVPWSNDILWFQHLSNIGYEIIKTNTYAYHFQCLMTDFRRGIEI